jgi:hypothetical protein
MRTLVIVLAISLAASTARAEPQTETGGERYGHWIAIADAASVALLVGGYAHAVATGDDEGENFLGGYLIMFGLFGYVGGSAAIHRGHDQNGEAIASVALRAVLPVAAYGLGGAFDADRRGRLGFVGGGALAAMAIDWFVLGRTSSRTASSVTLYTVPSRDGAIAGIATWF